MRFRLKFEIEGSSQDKTQACSNEMKEKMLLCKDLRQLCGIEDKIEARSISLGSSRCLFDQMKDKKLKEVGNSGNLRVVFSRD